MATTRPLSNCLRAGAVLSLLLLSACSTGGKRESEPAAPTSSAPSEAPCVCPAEAPDTPVQAADPGSLLVVGQAEYVVIADNVLTAKARIDTGATTTSLGAHDITPFERDGTRWVRFTIRDRVSGEEHAFEKPLSRMVEIKRHNASPDTRPVVRMPLTLGRVSATVEVSLNNRDAFDYPVLIGRNFMDGRIVVDVSKEYIALDEES